MNFEIGKTYGGFEVTNRTKCFVTFDGVSKKKIRLLGNGIEYTDNLHGYDDSIIKAIADPTVSEPVASKWNYPLGCNVEPTPAAPSPAPVLPTIDQPVAVSGAADGENITVRDGQGRYWQMVSADPDICVFELVQHREIGYSLPMRSMLTIEVQQLFGWGKSAEREYDRRYVRPCADGFGIQVYNGVEKAGYALAEPIWYQREDDPDFDRCAAMEQLERSWFMNDLHPLAFAF